MKTEPIRLWIDGPQALAHGAGAAADSPFLERFAGGLAERGLHVVRGRRSWPSTLPPRTAEEWKVKT